MNIHISRGEPWGVKAARPEGIRIPLSAVVDTFAPPDGTLAQIVYMRKQAEVERLEAVMHLADDMRRCLTNPRLTMTTERCDDVRAGLGALVATRREILARLQDTL